MVVLYSTATEEESGGVCVVGSSRGIPPSGSGGSHVRGPRSTAR